MTYKFLFKAASLAIILFLVSGLSACRTAPLRQPSFQVQANSQNQVGQAVKKALKARKWAIVRQNPGSIQARYSRSKHSATIGVDYSNSVVNIKLLDSKNLDQGLDRAGSPVIHKAYEKWISNLENDIYVELSHLNG